MKKYITVAALLAAGIAFANADADLTTALTVKDLTQAAANGTFSYDNGVLSAAGDENVVSQVTISFKLDLDKAKDVSLNRKIISLSSFAEVGVYLTTDGLRGDWQGNPWGTAISYDVLTGCLTATFDYKSTRWSGTGVQVFTTESANIASWGDLASQSNNIGYSAITINTDYISAVTIAKGIATQAQANSMASAVPEPSAFGLLAGIGALALVASRRRRK